MGQIQKYNWSTDLLRYESLKLNFVGNHKIRLNVTESTNSSLKDMAQNLLLPEGTLLVANLQTKGRGQMDSG